MNFISEHFSEVLIALGIILLAIEVAILGFATFILFFVGISLVITGVLSWVGLLPQTWLAVLLANAILSSILALILWKPFKKLQNQTEQSPAKNDFVGVRFVTEQAISKHHFGQYKYSGITWKVKSESDILANTEVEVVKAEVGTFWVKAV
ncbi:NfeD family protein [Catenovulum sp. 2E275]|uniref:NfeD family protein n=1 Tax=Catenovulum sp. 2E275 TaxID=2980497 RepID=UPI0021D2AF2C|nr:NfeD family protein [Catenovulum sp. 2E275]MCU4677524.1 NfeD family protein [Catenovulum sp. 2E275]